MATDLYSLIEQRPGHPNFGGPFYIGIGTKRRPRTHFAHAQSNRKHPNIKLQEVFEGHFSLGIEPAIRIIATFELLSDAFAAEKKAVRQYGRIGVERGGVLCNISLGGQGFESETMIASWADPVVRANRTAGMQGVKKTVTTESTEARRRNANAPKSAESLALMRAAAERNWADPAFVQQRSVNQTAAWEDPEKRSNMLAGRSDGVAQSWQNPEVRAARIAGIRRAAAAKSGPKAHKEPGMGRSAVMTAVNASISTEERSAIQTKSWTDPETAAARRAGIQKAAQDPALKAARLANMLAGKRRKAAERATQSGEGG